MRLKYDKILGVVREDDADGMGTGTVTSVAFSAPSIFTVSGSPITSSGTIALDLAMQVQNTILAGPSSGPDTQPTFRSLVNADFPLSGISSGIYKSVSVNDRGIIIAGTNPTTVAGYGITDITAQLLTGLSVSGGTIVSSDNILTGFGKLQNQLNAVAGAMSYQGTWNASTNSPTLTSSIGTKGYVYRVNVSGATNLDGIIDWKAGDFAVFNGSVWDKWDATDAVTSVNGYVGTVILTSSDITEGSNLYFTTTRVLNTLLTGYSTGTNTALASTDSTLIAFGKVQGQLNNTVKLTDGQSIGGVKTFTNTPIFSVGVSMPANQAFGFGSGASITQDTLTTMTLLIDTGTNGTARIIGNLKVDFDLLVSGKSISDSHTFIDNGIEAADNNSLFVESNVFYFKDFGGSVTEVATGLNLSALLMAFATTDDLPEGVNNLYYTGERVDDRVAGLIQNGTGLTWSYVDGLNTLTGNVSLSPFSTSNLSEGSNLYYTATRFNTAFAAKSTSDLTEGSNLYFTNSRTINSTLTGYVSGSGTISSSDTVLTAIQKLNGNIGLLVGAVIYQGTWNANTNTPTLVSGVGIKGYLYKVSVAGTTTIDGISQWNIGDSIVFDGTTWDKLDGVATEVTSVFGRVGAVVGAAADYSGVAMTGITSLNGLIITVDTGVVTTATWNATKIGLLYGGTNANLSATGGVSQVLMQTSAGAAITVAQLAASNLSNGTSGSGAVALVTSPTFTTSIFDPLLIGGTGTTSTLTFRTTSGSGTTGADFIWQSGSNGATELMRLLNSGQLTIGSTTAISTAVYIGLTRSSTGGTEIGISNQNTGANAYGGFSIANSVQTGYLLLNSTGATGGGINGTASMLCLQNSGANGVAIGGTGASSFVSFYTGGNAAANERIRITITPQIIINGTTAVATSIAIPLNIRTNGSGPTRIVTDNSNATQYSATENWNNLGHDASMYMTGGTYTVSGTDLADQMGLTTNGVGGILLGPRASATGAPLVIQTLGVERFRVKSSGEFLIGITTANQAGSKLELGGATNTDIAGLATSTGTTGVADFTVQNTTNSCSTGIIAWGSAAVGTLGGNNRTGMAAVNLIPATGGVGLINVGGAFSLVFSNNSTERIRILSTGEVGIGSNVATAGIQLLVNQITLGNRILSLRSVATNDDPTIDWYQNRLTTTNASNTVIHTVTIPSSTTVMMKGYVTCRRTGGVSGTAEDGGGWDIEAVYKNSSGVATLIGGGVTTIGKSQAGFDCQLSASSATVQIIVTGTSSNNVTWHLSDLRLMSVST